MVRYRQIAKVHIIKCEKEPMSAELSIAKLASLPTTNTSPLGRTARAHSCLFEVRSQTFIQLISTAGLV